MEKVLARVNDADTTLTFDQWLDRGRRWWKARAARVIECDLLFVLNAENKVMAVGRIEGVMKDLDSGSGRISIEVRAEEDNEWLGKTIERYTSRNPVVYVSEIREAK